MYRAIDLSKYIVSKCVSDNQPISNLQLQKILYYIQKDYLKRNEKAFSDDIETWQFGSVIPNVYYYYCGFGVMPIVFSRDSFELDIKDKNIIDDILKSRA